MSNSHKPGILLAVCGPSGVGKSTLCRRLLKEYPQMKFSVSYTTRPMRDGEEDGVHYNFIDKEVFKTMVAAGEFAEHAEVHGNFYGTARKTIDEAFANGFGVAFDIDYQGAIQLKEAYPETVGVLVLPPSMEELEERLRSRGTDSNEVIERRLKKAAHEIAQHEHFDFLMTNGDLDDAYDKIRAIYLATTLTQSRQSDQAQALL